MPGDSQVLTKTERRTRVPAQGACAGLAPADAALLALLRQLSGRGYGFVTPAPTTQRRILIRRGADRARSLEDVFGWNLPFDAGDIGPEILELMRQGGILMRSGRRLRSALRVATVGDLQFLHSGFGRLADCEVFFGPDSYRFVDFLRAELAPLRPGARVVDVGAGAGVGGVFAATRAPGARIVLADISGQALRLARINARFAGLSPVLRQGDGLPAEEGPFDLAVSNPPYILSSGRTYSDGGGALGSEVALRWTEAVLANLAPGGRMLLYTGSAIVRGHDALRVALGGLADRAGCSLGYRELDPDVFPATLLNRRYWSVERIAAVGAVLARPSR